MREQAPTSHVQFWALPHSVLQVSFSVRICFYLLTKWLDAFKVLLVCDKIFLNFCASYHVVSWISKIENVKVIFLTSLKIGQSMI